MQSAHFTFAIGAFCDILVYINHGDGNRRIRAITVEHSTRDKRPPTSLLLFSRAESLALLVLSLSLLVFIGIRISQRSRPAGGEIAITGTKTDFRHVINLNEATRDELTLVPGIGPVRADSIIQYRSRQGCLQSVDELLSIDGLNKHLLEQIRSYLTVEPFGRNSN